MNARDHRTAAAVPSGAQRSRDTKKETAAPFPFYVCLLAGLTDDNDVVHQVDLLDAASDGSGDAHDVREDQLTVLLRDGGHIFTQHLLRGVVDSG